jgi:hypothetical protein
MEENLTFRFRNGEQEVFPTHPMAKNWLFKGESSEEEARLAQAVAVVAEKNGMDENKVRNLFPAILRMLKSTSDWSK